MCISLIISLFSLQIGNEVFARQLIWCATGSLMLGASVLTYLIMRHLIRSAKGHVGKYEDGVEGFDYEEV